MIKNKEGALHINNWVNSRRSHNTPNNRIPKYVRQKLTGLKGRIDKSTTVVVDFNTALSVIDKSGVQKIIKGIFELNASSINLIKVTFIECSLQQLKNAHSSQAHTDHSPS